MEIINIDAETFERMLSKLESFAGCMEQLYRLHAPGKWVNG
jgi:hypothetical protein